VSMAVASELRIRPDRATFEDLARAWPMVPVWAELLADTCTPVGAFGAIASDGPGVLLESAEQSERWGRYSFVSGRPAAVIVGDDDGIHLLDVARQLPVPDRVAGPADMAAALREVSSALRAPRIPNLPTLSGGLVGFFSYEAARLLAGYPHPTGSDPACSPIALHVVDRAAVFDHWSQRLYLVAHVPSGTRYEKGLEALEELADLIALGERPQPESLAESSVSVSSASPEPERFREMVVRAKTKVHAGDIFQAVLSRRLTFPAPAGALPIYRRLRAINPSPYMFFVRVNGIELAGSSPEPLVRVEGRRVVTRPIAGTRLRGTDEAADRRFERELRADPKERAEHAMLVDLARNDLGRVCTPGSIRPTELMAVERFSRVMHLVSTVEGELAEGRDALDALVAAFPAGTVTGAPKRRAMEIIAAEEQLARGPYAGAAGYLSFSGDLDFCITIRTAVVCEGIGSIQAGAGVVSDSDPDREFLETESKAAAVLAAANVGQE
jgi:anthranilate synthase component I